MMGLVFMLNALLLASCTADAAPTGKNAEEQVDALVRQFYNDRLAGNHEEAAALLLFSERTSDMKDLFPGSFYTTALQSYTVNNIEKLTDELYSVNVIGLILYPFDLVYGEDGKVIGTKDTTGAKWQVNSFDTTLYVARINQKWGICISARFVPEGMYDFPENELKEPTGLPSLD